MRFKRRRIYYLAIWRNAQFAPRSRLKEGTWQHQFSATVLCMRRRKKRNKWSLVSTTSCNTRSRALNTSNAKLGSSYSFLLNKKTYVFKLLSNFPSLGCWKFVSDMTKWLFNLGMEPRVLKYQKLSTWGFFGTSKEMIFKLFLYAVCTWNTYSNVSFNVFQRSQWFATFYTSRYLNEKHIMKWEVYTGNFNESISPIENVRCIYVSKVWNVIVNIN